MEANEAHAPNNGLDQPHAVSEIQRSVDLTHPGLGQLAAISVVAAKARKCLLVVGPSGTGKSAVAQWLERNLPDAYKRGGVTIAGLRKIQDDLNNSEIAIIIDDLGEAPGEYHRVQILLVFTALCYGHEYILDTHQVTIQILNYYGSAWLGVQPAVLETLVKDPSWHSNVRDKAMRYYHLTRPSVENGAPISVPIKWGMPWPDMVPPELDHPLMPELEHIGRIQWSYARAREHIRHLLMSCAALDGRYGVDDTDYEVLYSLIRQMTIEREVIDKEGFDAQARLNRNLLLLLVEFASYPMLTYEIIGADYAMRPRKVQAVLENLTEYYYKVQNSPVVLVQSELLKSILEEAGIR